jgi:oligoendopeptidase F
MAAAPANANEAGELGPLPQWDLSDLYASPEAPELERDLKTLATLSAEFRRRYEGQLAALAGVAMLGAIEDYERVQDLAGRIGSYAQLAYAGNMADPALARFLQNVSERLNLISVETLFFTLELNRVDDAALARQLTHAPLRRYQTWLDALRSFRPHQLSDEAERLLHEKTTTGRQAWNRLFDETMAEMRFDVDGAQLTSNEVLHLMTGMDGAKRKSAGLGLAAGLGEKQRVFCLVTNTLAKDKEIEDRWRHFASPVSSRNLANQVEDEVVAALVAAVKASYKTLSHRYYRLKARWMGVPALDFWDRSAPLPQGDNRIIPWAEACSSVLEAYCEFSPELAETGRRFFQGNWIDAASRPGKDPGAFAHPTVPSAHPYLLLNYRGRTRDVMTLAHELGHGVHQVLAAPQGALLSDTPLTLAETASVFGEMLTFQSLLARESDPARRRILIAGKVEDMLNTVVRQVAMHGFETVLHDERRGGELMPERIAEIWLETQREALGPGIRLEKGSAYGVFWSYIPHFIHAPFYVYAYAFGDCLVNSLYAAYRGASAGFAGKYLDMLRSGSSRRHRELLAPFGLDAADPAFWLSGLGVVAGLIDELEQM